MTSSTPNFPAPAPSTDPDSPRYAIYFAPDAGTVLHRFGSTWLGRDAISGEELQQPALDGFDAETQKALTATARDYGFHATLKPPFHLKAGLSTEQLMDAADRFAAKRTAFEINLVARDLSGFLALMQKESKAAMRELAADCVRDFDPLRALPSEAELAKRREAGLSSQQELMLQRWGYPYVMNEFRFHMTLSKRLREDEQREALLREIVKHGAEALAAPVRVDAISIFHQENRSAPFLRLEHFPFGG
ncbi:MAG: DUF1045 domain-containing protein [Nisaea sp.]|uniref:DUF1045 domain-containing protein n=1 Tax=Nisaea sp. TaxID=2024842 RepID=UPI001B26FE06|nr:DUF1045 domain-containing protein [Nisaea sp.]MBO6562689.1 DUF1045 domain-containing protein [Nisaea sp.]